MTGSILARLTEGINFYRSQIENLNENIDELNRSAAEEFSRVLTIEKDLKDSETLLKWLSDIVGGKD